MRSGVEWRGQSMGSGAGAVAKAPPSVLASDLEVTARIVAWILGGSTRDHAAGQRGLAFVAHHTPEGTSV